MRVLVIALFSTLLFACGNMEQRQTSSGYTKECVDDACTSMFDVTMKKADRVISQRQVVPNFKKCLGLSNAQVSATTVAAYNGATSSLSLEGNPQDLNSAMLLAVTKVASEMCNDLINVEKTVATRNYFSGFTLSGSGDGSQPFDQNKTLNKFSNACWGRDVTAEERQLFETKFTAGTITKDAKGALLLCTTMLSSAEALRY